MNRRKEIHEELKDVAPTLAGIDFQYPYTVPAGYFDSLAENIMLRIRLENAGSAKEELEIISPLLSSLSKEMPFSTPAGYFDNLTPDIKAVEKVNHQPARVVKMFQPERRFRLAAAAVTIGIIGIAAWFILADKKIPFTIIRPTVVYGPGDNESGMIVKLISLIDKGKFFVLDGGLNKVQLIYIDDLATGYEKVIEQGGKNETYIFAGNEKIEMKNLAELIQKHLGKTNEIKSIPKTPLLLLSHMVEFVFKIGLAISPKLFSKEPPLLPSKVRILGNNWTYSTRLAEKALGLHPQISYVLGIKKTVEWFKKKNQVE